ncbi:hypothetical protein [uncultured Pseudoxanthomonas sp.]|uniref:hypothetical protein n=1 Tax=uncultured Pseudoxanthomonas sp. TaxID=281701 RepID=UPI00260D1FF5|nr:hypothetical protein [uncultured Pseudoxanthomonas sp.]
MVGQRVKFGLYAFLFASCARQDVGVQAHDAFMEAMRTMSTSPHYVKIRLVDPTRGITRDTCVTANLLRGALHLETGVAHDRAGTTAIDASLSANRAHEFVFTNPAAFANMPSLPELQEINEASQLVSGLSGPDIAESLSEGPLANFTGQGARQEERLAALACALIDRGYRPRQADLTGAITLDT